MDATIRDGFLAATHIFNGYDASTDEYNHPFRGCPCTILKEFPHGKDGVSAYAYIAPPLAIEPYILMNGFRGTLTPAGALSLMSEQEDIKRYDEKDWFVLPVDATCELTKIKFKDKSGRDRRKQKEGNK